MRILLFVKPLIATSTALSFSLEVLCGRRCDGHLSFNRHTDGPNKAQQIATDCGHDLVFVLSSGKKFLISHVKSILSLPRNLSHLRARFGLAFQNLATQPRSVLISPSRLHDHASQMSVAGFRDAAMGRFVSCRVFAGYQAVVSHQLLGSFKAGDLAQLRYDSRQFSNTAKKEPSN